MALSIFKRIEGCPLFGCLLETVGDIQLIQRYATKKITFFRVCIDANLPIFVPLF